MTAKRSTRRIRQEERARAQRAQAALQRAQAARKTRPKPLARAIAQVLRRGR